MTNPSTICKVPPNLIVATANLITSDKTHQSKFFNESVDLKLFQLYRATLLKRISKLEKVTKTDSSSRLGNSGQEKHLYDTNEGHPTTTNTVTSTRKFESKEAQEVTNT